MANKFHLLTAFINPFADYDEIMKLLTSLTGSE